VEKMREKKALQFFIALATILLLLGTGSVSVEASATNVTIGTANGTVFNTTTPTILLTCTDELGPTTTFNVSIFSTNSTADQTAEVFLVANTSTVENGTQTGIVLNSISPPAEVYYAVGCFNGTGSTGSTNAHNLTINSSALHFQVNVRPNITLADPPEAYIAKNNPTRLRVTWGDNNITIDPWGGGSSTSTDGNTIYVCSTNSFQADNSGCSATTLCSTSIEETDADSFCDYTIAITETPGTKTAYAFAVDGDNYVSTGVAINYRVAGSSGFIDHETGITDQEALSATTPPPRGGDKSLLFILLFAVGIVIIVFLINNFTRKT